MTFGGRNPTWGNEARIGRFHQGQRAESPAPKAGYKTAICLPVILKSVLAFREASIQPPYDQANPEQNAPAPRCEEEERRDERSEIGCGETPERQARPDRGPARTNGRSDDRGTCRCDGLAETFGPRRSEPAPVSGLRHSSGIDGGTEGLSARTGRGVSHVSYGNPHYGKPNAR